MEVARVEGHVGRIMNGEELATLSRCVNYNADILEELIYKVSKLEKIIEQTEEKE